MKRLFVFIFCIASTLAMANELHHTEDLYDYENVEENEMENQQPVENFNQKPTPDTSKTNKK